MKRILIIGAVALVLIVGAAIWISSTAWERDLTVHYVDRVSNKLGGSDWDLYEITNNTNRTLRNAEAEIEILAWSNRKWTFTDYVGTFRVGETKEYKLYWSDVQDSAASEGQELMFATVDIKRIRYE